MSKGIDVSEHNGVIDWQKVAASGIDFAIIRAGLGCKSDARFKENIQGAARAGLAVCVYWFAYALDVNGAVKEADFCAKIIAPYGKQIYVYYDFEYDTERYAAERNVQYSKRSRTDIIKAFCDRMIRHGYRCGVYINVDYLAYRTNRTELSKYTLWLAAWATKTAVASFADTRPEAVNTAYGKPEIWQFGKTSVPGIAKMCDVDYCYSDMPRSAFVSLPPLNELQRGDKCRAINCVMRGRKKQGRTYGGGWFTIFYDVYDVLSVSGDRVVIGVGKTVTAAVKREDLEKV